MSEISRERVISERVVSRKVIGSANPIARKVRAVKSSFGGVCFGLVLIPLAIGALFFSERLTKNSIVVESLQLEQASEVTATSGMHKMSGKPVVIAAMDAPQVGKVLYYSYKEEEYRQVEETEYETVTKIENGVEVEEEIERTKLVDKWVEINSSSGWAQFNLGSFTVEAAQADLKVDLASKTYYEDLEGYVERTVGEPYIGQQRIVVSYLPVDTELIIIGELTAEKVQKGEIFIITDKSDAQLIADLKAGETAAYWGLKFVSWLLFTLGFLSILSPILSILDFIPIAGRAASCVASIIGALLALGIVIAGTLIIKFWWLCLGLFVVGGVGILVLLIALVARKKEKEEGKKEPEGKSQTEKFVT